MSGHYLSLAQRLTAAQAGLEELTQQLLVTCTQAHYLVAHLESLLADAGIQQATHRKIAECVALVGRLLAEHGVAAGMAALSLGDIAERLRDRDDVQEE
jgi:hypothetical protein